VIWVVEKLVDAENRLEDITRSALTLERKKGI